MGKFHKNAMRTLKEELENILTTTVVATATDMLLLLVPLIQMLLLMILLLLILYSYPINTHPWPAATWF